MNRNFITLFVLALTVLSGAASASALTSNHVVTMWWVVFNNPAACGTSPCGDADLGVPEVEASVLYASGTIASGNIDFISALFESSSSVFDVDGNTSVIGGPGLVASRDAEIHLVVRDHGPAIPGLVDQQLTEFIDPGCSDVGGPNTCVDTQYAVFMTGEDVSQSEVFRFEDNSVVEGARAMLIRQDGLVKTVVVTQID